MQKQLEDFVIDSTSHEFLRAECNALLEAIDAVSQGVVVCDATGAVVYESNSVHDWLHPTGQNGFGMNALHEALSISGRGRRNTRTIEILGPPIRSLVISCTPILDSQLNPVGAVAVLEDTTEGRHHEALLRDFVANVSHELKTPVGALGLLAEALQVEDDPQINARLLQRMQVETMRVTRVIDDLLNLSSVEVPGQHQNAALTLRAIVSQAMAGVSYAAEHRNITVEVEIEGEPQVFGSLRHLVSAFHHLLENAVKYSPENCIVTLRATSDGAWTDVELIDRGIGIPREYVERIFERFFRVDDARKRTTGGTGLGLSIVRQVVQRHGGEVRVESTESEGTTFFVRLPAVPAVAGRRRIIEGGEDG